jgi:predicted PurR-regulated permease PerM
MGVPFFLPIALAMLFLGLIPLFGSFVGALLVAFSTLAAGGLNRALLALLLFLVYQQIAAHLLSPLVQQRTIKMNPFLLTVVLIAGAGLDGLIGATLALPFAAAIQELLRDVQERRERRWRRKRRALLEANGPELPRPH